MASTATVTGKTGPAVTLTAGLFTGVVAFAIATNSEVLTLTLDTGRVLDVDISAATTITCTIVAPNNYTLTVA